MKLQLLERGDQTTAEVTLSRRNLLTLLHKLEMPGSARLLYSQYCQRDGRLDDELLLIVCVEDDLEHYGQRGFGPGPMHPLTEAFVADATMAQERSDDDQPSDRQGGAS